MSDEVEIVMVLLCELLNDSVVGGVGMIDVGGVGMIDVGGVAIDKLLDDGAFDLGEGHGAMIGAAG